MASKSNNECGQSVADEKMETENSREILEPMLNPIKLESIDPMNGLIDSKSLLSRQLNMTQTGNENRQSVLDEKMEPIDDDKDDDDNEEKRKKKEEKINYLRFTIDVGGIGPVNDALIDSGSDFCIIRRDQLTDAIIAKIKPTKCTAKLTDESIMTFLGEVDLNVSYRGSKTVKMNFLVVHEWIVPMILGANWIMKSRATLQSDGKELGVTFGGKKEKFCWSKWFFVRPFVTVNVDRIGLLKALVDTGATNSSIRSDLLTTDLKLTKMPTYNSVVAGNGNITKPEGLVSLNVKYQEITTSIENVNIKSKAPDPFTLGVDWIHKTRVVIQSNGRKIIVSHPGLQPTKKKSERLISWISEQWSSTFGSISRIFSLASNLM